VGNATNAHDVDLVTRVMGAGSDSAECEAVLCDRLLPRVRLFLARRLADSYAVDDVAQDVIVTLIVALRAGAIRDVEAFGSFVLGVCRNKVREHVRRGVPFAGEGEAERMSAPAPVRFEVPRPLLGRLEECLGMLRERDRTLLRLTFCETHTCVEIGARLGLSEANVRVIRHRALARLRECALISRYELER